MYSVNTIIAHDSQSMARHIFFSQFEQIHRRARINHAWSTLRRQEHHLQDLFQAKETEEVNASQHVGVQLVSIDRIRGSEGRSHDFDTEFRPLKKHIRERWLSVATARYLGHSLPPISLVRLGCTYFVRDGHHRISVAKALGQHEIEAEVTLWNAESDEVCQAA